MLFWFVFQFDHSPQQAFGGYRPDRRTRRTRGKSKNLANPSWKWTYQNIIKRIFLSLAPHPSVEFGELGDGSRAGIGRVRTVHQLSVVFQSGKSTCGFSSARYIWADDVRFRNSTSYYYHYCFSNVRFGFDRMAAAFCAPSTRETITTYPCGTGRRTKRVTRSRRPRSVESLITIIVIRYLVVVIIVWPCGLPPFGRWLLIFSLFSYRRLRRRSCNIKCSPPPIGANRWT